VSLRVESVSVTVPAPPPVSVTLRLIGPSGGTPTATIAANVPVESTVPVLTTVFAPSLNL
jgi:hypothetical protein